MKFSLAVLSLLAVSFAAPAPAASGTDQVQPLLDTAEQRLEVVGAQTASGNTIPLVVLKNGVFDPTSGDFVSNEDLLRSAKENGYVEPANEKRILFKLLALKAGLLSAAFGGGKKFGGGQTITNINNNYNWNDFTNTLHDHGVGIGGGWSGCNTCMTFNRGGASLGGFNVDSGYNIPSHRSWYGGCDSGCA